MWIICKTLRTQTIKEFIRYKMYQFKKVVIKLLSVFPNLFIPQIATNEILHKTEI